MARITIKRLVLAVLLALVVSSCAFAQTSANYGLTWYCFNSGGGSASSTSYIVNSTIGQSLAGTSTGTTYKLWGGFWVPGGGGPIVVVETIDEAKLLADGIGVEISGKRATSSETDFNAIGYFYIEEPDRSSGIRVATTTSVPFLARGYTVKVTGTMGTTAAGERQVTIPTVEITIYVQDELAPVGTINRSIGGGSLGNPPEGQYGVAGASGLNNIGLLVKAWGEVKEKGADYLVIEDGSGVLVRVDTTGLTTLPNVSTYAYVTGISSLYKPGANRERLILPRDDADIVP